MLSFLREQGASNLPEGPTSEIGPAQGDTQEYLTVAANSKSLRRSTILVMILVAIGLAALGYMIRKSQPQAASAEPAADQDQIEVAISRLTGVSAEMVSRMDEIVKRFYEFSDVFQVEVTELAKNPFEVAVAASATPEESTKRAEDKKAEAVRLLREQVTQRADALKLLSVMRSDSGDCCMINDRILREGETIEGFRVATIRGDSVDLTDLSLTPATSPEEAEVLKIQLKLAQ